MNSLGADTHTHAHTHIGVCLHGFRSRYQSLLRKQEAINYPDFWQMYCQHAKVEVNDIINILLSCIIILGKNLY